MNIKKIIYGIVSLVVGFPSLVANAQIATTSDSSGSGFQVPTGTNLPGGSIVNIVTKGMQWLLTMVGILGVIGFVIAGIIYLTAAGDEDQIARGKKTMVASITGVIVALIGVVIIQAVKGMLSGNSTNF